MWESNKSLRRWIILCAMAAALMVSGCGSSKVRAYCGYTREVSACAYDTVGSCRAAMSGDAGFCAANPAYRVHTR